MNTRVSAGRRHNSSASTPGSDRSASESTDTAATSSGPSAPLVEAEADGLAPADAEGDADALVLALAEADVDAEGDPLAAGSSSPLRRMRSMATARRASSATPMMSGHGGAGRLTGVPG